MQSRITECEKITDVVAAVTALLMDSNGNILSAITHGHQTETYIYWINSMFGGYKGWYGNTSATSVTIPDTRTIAYGAFYNCNSLTDIVIPDSLTEIASCTFYGCSSLTSIVIPDTVKKIGDYAFVDCSGLTEVTLPISAEYNIGGASNGGSFYTCKNVQKITYTVGDGSIFDPEEDIYGYTLPDAAREALTSVIYEEGISAIPRNALKYCSNVSSVTLPSTVKKIGNYAFYGCSSLTSVTFENPNGWQYFYTLYTYLSKREAVGAYQDDLDLFLSMADVNGDGVVNILDYQRLYMALTGAAPLS